MASSFSYNLTLHTGSASIFAGSRQGWRRLQYLDELALQQDEPRRARRLVEESLKLVREMGHRSGAASALENLGWAATRLDDLPAAISYLK